MNFRSLGKENECKNIFFYISQEMKDIFKIVARGIIIQLKIKDAENEPAGQIIYYSSTRNYYKGK